MGWGCQPLEQCSSSLPFSVLAVLFTRWTTGNPQANTKVWRFGRGASWCDGVCQSQDVARPHDAQAHKGKMILFSRTFYGIGYSSAFAKPARARRRPWPSAARRRCPSRLFHRGRGRALFFALPGRPAQLFDLCRCWHRPEQLCQHCEASGGVCLRFGRVRPLMSPCPCQFTLITRMRQMACHPDLVLVSSSGRRSWLGSLPTLRWLPCRNPRRQLSRTSSRKS
jgi:hypothetical protein